ncbi:LysR family transcriptional regulator [Alteromonas oceanisediminis]|uniref:LysR family transcriptional regulator n=1 Tax=Alteromonas oceanisediminis TaxID=2836180 RepID=UPI001BD9B428|nr:LysR family transcriptional regulator [Alteromonas oceanisediminis]MBT0587166.1 LysR family transcriptional regulator [Alteromonas oceanisediminis]
MFSPKSVNAFVRLAESKTFAEAADKLHITQPALSTSIRKLEAQLGGKLFSRNTRNVQLTMEGKTFLPAAKRLLLDWSNSLTDMQSLFAVQQGTLTIAAMPSFAEGMLPGIIANFLNAYPNVKIRVLDVVMEEVIDCVLSGRAEIGFTFAPEQLDGLTFSALFDDRFMAIVSREHLMAKADSLDWLATLQQPFVAMNRQSSVRRWVEGVADEHKVNLNVVAEANQLSTVGQLVAHNIGVSIVPALCEAQMVSKGIRCIALEQLFINKPVGLLTATRGSLSVAAEAFRSHSLR